jgi:hypothetical protein
VNHPYEAKTAVLTSKHQKLDLIRPSLEQATGLNLIEQALDTDQLGTFSGEIERPGTPLEVAINKAKLGMVATGLPLGVASEGSIGPDPLVPFVISNIETLVFVDQELDIVISETFRSLDIVSATTQTFPGQDLTEYLAKVGFPEQRVIVKSSSGGVEKGLGSISSLEQAIAKLALQAHESKVSLEPDYRAMHCPTRRINIVHAAKALAFRVASLCPECNAPGWGKKDFVRGLRCSDCGSDHPDAIAQELKTCVRCDFVQPGMVLAESLDPSKCFSCNP